MQERCADWMPSCFIVDASLAEINAISAAFGPSVKIFLCTWHFFKALSANLKKKVRNDCTCCIASASHYVCVELSMLFWIKKFYIFDGLS